MFLALSIEPRLASALEEPPPRPCPNATCPSYAPPSDPDPLTDGRAVERHCPVCGCRFRGRRILLCFDEGHGAALPGARSVRRARRRLERWRRALADQVALDLLEGREVGVVACFRRAGIPRNANLRASRLGLADIVRDAARRQRLVRGEEPAATSLVSMAEWRVLLAAARDGRWWVAGHVAQAAQVHPAHEVPPLGSLYRDPRGDPLHGLLDPLVDPALAARLGGPEAVRDMVRAQARVEDPGRLLSPRWDRRVAALTAGDDPGPVVPLGDYSGAFRGRLSPEARAFAYGEWCPPYLLGLLAASWSVGGPSGP